MGARPGPDGAPPALDRVEATRPDSLKGDLAGGTTSAVLTVPVSMGYGVLALLPLGDQYISVAVLAGLYSAIFLPLTILLLGDRNALMYAPRSVVTFLLASVVAGHGRLRSATLTADEELVCYVLDDAHFRALTEEHPSIAIRLLTNLSRELSRRLRKANAMISQLEG
jgi:hypothetical protein